MKKFGLIGYPLSHSFSKKYFTEKFEKEQLDCSFELYPIRDIDAFPSLLSIEPRLIGLAVTIPHKRSVMKYLTVVSPEARVIGSVNCIVINKEGLTGHNTDAIGFEMSLSPLLKSNHTSALVLGTGGSSMAVQYVLKKLGIPFKLVSSSGNGDLSYERLIIEHIRSHPIIINCTPVGMFPDVNAKPALPYDAVTKEHLLYDLIYNPEKTEFLKEGERRSAVIKNGMEMLVLQAEENWELWNG